MFMHLVVSKLLSFKNQGLVSLIIGSEDNMLSYSIFVIHIINLSNIYNCENCPFIFNCII